MRRFDYVAGTVLALGIMGAASQSNAQSFPSMQGEVPRDLERLNGETLREAFSGRTMDGTYKLPLKRSGTNYFTETFTEDGRTIYKEGQMRDTGQWVIVDDANICFRYTGPMAGSISCFAVFRDGSCLYSYDPGNIVRGKPTDPNLWSAKTATRGELSGCDDLFM